ncbi:PREDICTED: putative clathrin assembly protein At5g35200 [Tarenaya hassleriana]|uniref:putative clathrin assembly protein At5g35200 n=1 Tax=Tarenaya hassleriana TaxID=28532 RepID=UPI00053C19BB|nr:PREDICTED: putative clathrin assembly protein At5g35200 [Tarenaya hassleriana]
MSGGGSQSSLRKYLGAIKDTTTVSLAKVNSDYKELDIAIVKATNHVERPSNEKYIRAIFMAISATRPRADVAYCIHALARRLSRTHNWAVALKTLIVIHRALREVDQTFHEEVINYSRSRSHMLNMSHFKDDSSPNAWDYSAWVRAYALFLESWLECFRVLKYDVEIDAPRTKDLDTPGLLEQLPALQQLLFRVLGCQPEGASVHNHIIQLALSMVASESTKIYQALTNGIDNLVDKFFEMQRNDALKALDIYRRAGKQAERLSEFYEVCKSIYIGRGDRFTKIEQPPASFLQAMEEYVMEAPLTVGVKKELAVGNKLTAPKEVLAIEYEKPPEVVEEKPSTPPPPEVVKEETQKPVAQQPDLLSLDDPAPVVAEIEEKNALALAIVPVTYDQPTSATVGTNVSSTGWELALVTTPSSNEHAAANSKLAGGLDKLTLDSLYDDAIRASNQTRSYNPWEPASFHNGSMVQTTMMHQDPFFASNPTVSAPPSFQMSSMGNHHHHQQGFMYGQPNQGMTMRPPLQHPNPYGSNPFVSNGNTNTYGHGVPVQGYNPYSSFL